MDRELLQRYVEGNASGKETEAVADWLDGDEKNVREFMALHKLYDISLWNKGAYRQSEPPQNAHDAVHIKNKPGTGYKKAVYELLKIVAVFLAFLSVSHLMRDEPTSEPGETTYQTLFIPAGQRAELTLPDSTKVWLNAKTKLVYPVNFGAGDRTVILDGEAYFKVKHKGEQAFVVKTENMNVKVLGTEFNIMAYSGIDNAEVAVLKGSVGIEPQSAGLFRNYVMNVNEHAMLNSGKLKVSGIKDFDYFRWKEGLLCFNNETVKSIINKLQLYFDVTIDVKKQNLQNYRYSGKFRTKDGVEQVLKVLQLEHKFMYTRDNELNLITINL
jgi:ferric-dicitrate binding protein FerR (iron transport regulator)